MPKFLYFWTAYHILVFTGAKENVCEISSFQEPVGNLIKDDGNHNATNQYDWLNEEK